jgi:hypothetical protein
MGTSSGYEAPTTPDWGDLKAQVTRTARDGSVLPRIAKNTLNDFIRTSGGAHNISRGGGAIGAGRSAQNTARRLADFVSSVGTVGLRQTLESFGLAEFIGKPVSEIIPAIIDKLGGPSSTINDADARNALSKVMDELLNGLDTPEQVEEALNQIMEGETLEGLLDQFFGYYLYEQFCRVFYERLVNRVGQSNADSYLDSILDTIKSALDLMTSDRDLSQIDWAGVEGQNIADQILQDTYEIFGG